jgi:GAF domain-containing protein
MNDFKQMVTPARVDDPLFRLRQRYIQILTWAGIVMLVAASILDFLLGTVNALNVLMLVFMGVAAAVLVLAHNRRLNLAAGLLLASLIVMSLLVEDGRFVAALLTLITAATITPLPVYIVINVIVIGSRLPAFITVLAEPGMPRLWEEFDQVTALLIASVSLWYFIHILEGSIRDSNRRAALLRATTEVSEIASTILDLQELFTRSVNQIRDSFGFYHVQVFMVNGNQAELVASTGEVGQQLLANRHRLAVGSNSVIGRVTRLGEPVIARDTETDAMHYHNPLLPDTRAELAVPILDSETVIGALDLQSTRPDTFQPEDVEALQAMANLLAAAIRNAQLFQDQQASVREQQRLYLESEASLREIQRLNRQLTRASWQELAEQPTQVTGVTLKANEILNDTTWSAELIAAVQRQQAVTQATNGRPGVVAVPLVLRGEVIGAIEVEPGAESDIEDAVQVVDAIAQRLATSLENIRLFEEAQATTVQEQHINRIAGHYQTATSVDELLRITLVELSEVLGAQSGAIRLGRLAAEQEAES